MQGFRVRGSYGGIFVFDVSVGALRYVPAMPRALVGGGTGLIGRATARRLLAAGWHVDLTGRTPAHLPADIAAAGGKFVAADRDDSDQLLAALGDGADLLVDCICYTADDATRLLPLVRDAGSTVMISSKAVYVDGAGHHSNSATAPRFDGPIRETQPTVAPGDADYTTRDGYGANKVAAEQVLLDSGWPVTVLRPSKIHGASALMPREWVFVKRVLDRRPVVFLAHRGAGVDHRRPPPTLRRSSRWSLRHQVSGSSTVPIPTHRAHWRSRARSHGSSTTFGTRCCSTTGPMRRWAGIPGTRRTRSCST